MKKLFFAFIFLLSVFLFPQVVLARLGVGVGTGKIIVTEKLKPGIIYDLPPLTVINTGDQASDYAVGISYLEKQPQLRPEKSWFIFSPQKFYLEPGKVQVVNVKLNLPIIIKPGDYFAYVEGFPATKSKSGNNTIGIAAAAKLYFTVVPANIFMGIYYKTVSLWNIYSTYIKGLFILLVIISAYIVFKKHFNIQINLKNKQSQQLSRREKVSQKRGRQENNNG